MLRTCSTFCLILGVTFDTGGISTKPSAGMGAMKGDMGGAACVVATVMAIAQLECLVSVVSVVGLVPLCENMPSGNAVGQCRQTRRCRHGHEWKDNCSK
jgi:leucyl aminopeptidase